MASGTNDRHILTGLPFHRSAADLHNAITHMGSPDAYRGFHQTDSSLEIKEI